MGERFNIRQMQKINKMKIENYENKFEHGNIRLFQMDNMEFMKQIPDNYYELAIVDPPYGIGMDNQKVRTKPNRSNSYLRAGEKQYHTTDWDSETPDKEYFNQLFRVSKNQVIWGANYFCEDLPSGKGWIYWDKQMGDNNFSSGEFAYQSIQTKSSCFSEPSMRVHGTRIHPTQKPVALYKWILDKYAKEGDKILDTHGGSMSISIACHDYKYSLDLCELDKEYFDKGVKRFQEHTKQLSLF